MERIWESCKIQLADMSTYIVKILILYLCIGIIIFIASKCRKIINNKFADIIITIGVLVAVVMPIYLTIKIWGFGRIIITIVNSTVLGIIILFFFTKSE